MKAHLTMLMLLACATAATAGRGSRKVLADAAAPAPAPADAPAGAPAPEIDEGPGGPQLEALADRLNVTVDEVLVLLAERRNGTSLNVEGFWDTLADGLGMAWDGVQCMFGSDDVSRVAL